jgi:hypothetical protein
MRIPPAPRAWVLALWAASGCIPPARLSAQQPALAASTPAAYDAAVRVGPLPGTVEIGVSAGVAHTSRWYDAGGEPGTVESGTALSAEVRYWPVPWLGLRLQAGRFDAKIRTAPVSGATVTPGSPQEVDAAVYDASLVVRPLAVAGVPGPLSTVYAFAGSGSVELDLAGGPDSLVICHEETGCGVEVARGGTVRQSTAGAGADLLEVAGFTLFAEASLHRYRPPFERRHGLPLQVNVRAGIGGAVPPRRIVGSLADPATVDAVVTRRFAAGVRRAFGARPRVTTPPPPPPPSPTTGGIVTVRTAEPGAEVYLVPRSVLEDEPGLRCRLRPVLAPGSYFAGRTTGAQPLRVPAGPRAWVLVVRQQVVSGGRRVWHVHEQRVQLAGGSTLPVQLDMRRDGSPPPPCPR